MIRRFRDVIISLMALLAFSPILVLILLLVYLQDFSNPFYIAKRTGLRGKQFYMVKIRSMIINADSSGVDSTSSNDKRITHLGKLIRKTKLDEIAQLWNVLTGDMSLIGPRPNVKSETDLYTPIELKLLTIRPGITDYSSIVFSDEGSILQHSVDPDIDYNQLIRPGKSRLGLFYVKTRTHLDDIVIILLTFTNSIHRAWTLKKLSDYLKYKLADEKLWSLALRNKPLEPCAPPGSDHIVTSRYVSIK